MSFLSQVAEIIDPLKLALIISSPVARVVAHWMRIVSAAARLIEAAATRVATFRMPLRMLTYGWLFFQKLTWLAMNVVKRMIHNCRGVSYE